MAKKAIIIGAASGIGRELAKIMFEHEYELGLVDINADGLNTLHQERSNKCYVQIMDISRTDEAMTKLKELINTMEDVDIIILNAGVRLEDPDLDWEKQQKMIDVNVLGFTALANVAMHYFIERKKGQLVGVSSIAGLRGHRFSPIYDGTKAFIDVTLQGLRDKVKKMKLPIVLTTIQPGFVDTQLSVGMKKIFWMVPVKKAAKQIYDAIVSKRKHAYISKRWRPVAWALRWLPDWILQVY